MALKKVEPPMLTTQPSRAAAHVEKALGQASKPVVKESRLNVRLDADTHEQFWRACKRSESDMTTEVKRFIEEYIERHSR